MKIAFCLHSYFPYGGLQRDFLKISRASQAKGNQVRVYTFAWKAKPEPGYEIIIVPKQGLSNHARNLNFSKWVKQHISQHPVDVVVGFNKMPGLDYYFAADVCYAEKTQREKGVFYKLTPRYRSYMQAEKAVMSSAAKTQILVLTEQQKKDFQLHYQTQDERFHLLPPGIDIERFQQLPPATSPVIEQLRLNVGVKPDEIMLLQVGSDFKRKGVDRSIRALAALPTSAQKKSVLVVVGEDNPQSMQALAESLGISQKVHFYAGREDIHHLMVAADILLHPAYQEAGGIVIIEAIACKLPVLVSAVCGFAFHVSHSGCGEVLDEPFSQQQLNNLLSDAVVNPELRQQWQQRGAEYLQRTNLYQLAERASDIIMGKQADANS